MQSVGLALTTRDLAPADRHVVVQELGATSMILQLFVTPAAWSAPPSPPRVWLAGTGQAAGAAESTSRRRGSRSGHTMRELAIEIGVRALLFGVFV